MIGLGLASGKWRAFLREKGAFHGQAAPSVYGDFEAEAVRLVEMSRRTQKEIATDLGIGLSTLRRWLDMRRERELEVPPSDRQEDLAAELKRLRRENEILQQEREILKRAATFFAKEGVDEVSPHRCGEEGFPVQRLCKVLGVSASGYFRLSAPARGHGAARSHSLGLCRVE